jgi:hypothetical protein
MQKLEALTKKWQSKEMISWKRRAVGCEKGAA